jgi:hypothetical protein
MRDADKDSLGRLLAAVNGIDDAVFEMAANLLPAALPGSPDDQSMLRACI